MNAHAATPAPATPARWDDLDTAGRAAAIRAMHGKTTKEIAEALGTSPGAVHGLSWRKNIHTEGAYIPMRSTAFQAAPDLPAETWEPLGPPVAEPTRKQCCWPVGEASGSSQMFCGLPKARGSYCDHHANMAYRPAGPAEYVDAEQRNELLRFIRDSEIKETVRVAFGRVRGEGVEE